METEDLTPPRARSRRTAVADRLHARIVLRRHAPELLALWGLAVAQPLLDLFGKNPEFFVVNGLSRVEVVLFAVLVLLGGPAVLVAVQLLAYALRPWLGDAVHAASVALLAAALALTILAQLGVDDSAVVVLSAAFLGVLVAYLEYTVPRVGSGLRYLALTGIVFIAAFVGFSPTADLVWGQEAEPVAAGDVGHPAPIVFLSLDEFPLASLLRPDGTIDAERFPNFARLAGTSSWFRTATSISPVTEQSVPATLTGVLPQEEELPTAEDHPRSIFTLLGEAYEQHVQTQVVDICPDQLCPEDTGMLDLGRLRTSLTDAAAVYAQAALPPSLRGHFPAVDRSWGGFIDEANAEAAPDDAPEQFLSDDALSEPSNGGATPVGPDLSCPDTELWCGSARVSEMVAGLEPVTAEQPVLHLVHGTTPHAPWIRTATGDQYQPRSLALPGVTLQGGWSADTDLIRQGFQRHLLQIGYVDRQLGQMMDRMEEQGWWDEALVVVTADHGIAFRPDAPLRAPTPETVHEIYNVPLFVKVPRQVEGEVRDDNALTIDVLPTIVDALDIEADWTFDGRSLLAGDTGRPDKPVVFGIGHSVVPLGFDGVLEVVRRNQSYVPAGGGPSGVVAIGAYRDLVGRPLADLDTLPSVGRSWTADEGAVLGSWDPGSDQLAPVLLHGHLGPTEPATPSEALVVVNGTVAGAAVGFGADASGTIDFTALIDEATLRPGANVVSLLVPISTGSRTFTIVPLTA